jgi:hypothetical protein
MPQLQEKGIIDLNNYTEEEITKGIIDFYKEYGKIRPNMCAMFFKTMSNGLGYEIKKSIGELPNGTTVNAWHMSQTLIKDGYTRKDKSEFKNYTREDIEKLPIGTAFLIQNPNSSALQRAKGVVGGDGSTHIAILIEIDGERKIVDLRGQRVRKASIDEFFSGTGEGKGYVNLQYTKSIMIPDETKKVQKYKVNRIPNYNSDLQKMLNESWINGPDGHFQLAAIIPYIEHNLKKQQIALTKIVGERT